MDTSSNCQHHLECDVCSDYSPLYCNTCHKQLCEKCQDDHLKTLPFKDHEVVPYRQRQKKLPEEPCVTHPTRSLEMWCEECQIPLCSRCATSQIHSGHSLEDLEVIYNKYLGILEIEIEKIDNFFPTAEEKQNHIQVKVAEVKAETEQIRTTLTCNAESLKGLVDDVVLENMKMLETRENFLLLELKGKDKIMNDFILYLKNVVKQYEELSVTGKFTELMPLVENNGSIIKDIPMTTEHIPPVFKVISKAVSKSDIAKLLGIKADFGKTRTKTEIKTATEKNHNNEDDISNNEKSIENKNESLEDRKMLPKTCFAIKIKEIEMPSVCNSCHITVHEPESFWVSGDSCYYDGCDGVLLIQTDFEGSLRQKLQVSGMMTGFHTVTESGDLLFVDVDAEFNCIKRLAPDMKMSKFITTGEWEPLSICFSRMNGDIIVGMETRKAAKVTRYNKTGDKIQEMKNIHKRILYQYPHYLAENFNGDICASDREKNAVVVVDKSGKYRFSYTGQPSQSRFLPRGICTDMLGHILVSDGYKNSVHLVNQEGQFVSLLITRQHGISRPFGLCLDNENNLCVGESYLNRVNVFRYLE